MKVEGIYKKYLLYYRLLKKPFTYPDHARVLSFLAEQGISISKRTLERDFAALRTEFGFYIEYNKIHKGYFLAEEDNIDGEDFFKLLELAEKISDLIYSFKNIRDNKKYIRFSNSGSFKGTELIPFISEAIKSSRWILIDYQTYSNQTTKQRELIPLFLFEFRHRWYLLGRENGIIKTFGLDRIQKTCLLPLAFDPKEQNIDFQEYFRHTLGVSWHDKPPEEILLSFHPSQAPYLKSLPLHDSQSVIQENSEACIIRLHLVINFELKQEILGYGCKVKVLAPAGLAEEIRQELQEAVKGYHEII